MLGHCNPEKLVNVNCCIATEIHIYIYTKAKKVFLIDFPLEQFQIKGDTHDCNQSICPHCSSYKSLMLKLLVFYVFLVLYNKVV